MLPDRDCPLYAKFVKVVIVIVAYAVGGSFSGHAPPEDTDSV